MQMVRQVDTEKRRPRNAAAQSLVAAGQQLPRQDRRVDQHLERQRNEGGVDLLQPHADSADDGRHHEGDDQCGDEGHRDRHAGLLHHQAEAIGAKAEEHAVAERDQPGIADEQIERRRKQAVGRAADDEIEQLLTAEERGQQCQHDKGRERDQDVAIALRPGIDPRRLEALRALPGLQFGHATSLPNRPVGRDTSTITMKRYISPSVNSGKPSEPKERIRPISNAPTSAPRIEPMPPITVTMKDSIRTENPMPGVSERTGAASAPANPASMPPSANTPP